MVYFLVADGKVTEADAAQCTADLEKAVDVYASWAKGMPSIHAHARIQFKKWWIERDWMKTEKLSKAQRQNPHLIPRQLVEKYWEKDVISREHVLDLELDLYDVDKIWRLDHITISKTFFNNQLVPAALREECMIPPRGKQ